MIIMIMNLSLISWNIW